MEEKICPFLTPIRVEKGDTVNVTYEPVNCLREKCEWWVEDKQKCAVTAIGSVRR